MKILKLLFKTFMWALVFLTLWGGNYLLVKYLPDFVIVFNLSWIFVAFVYGDIIETLTDLIFKH